MIGTGEKILYSIMIGVSLGIIFGLYETYFSCMFPIDKNLYLIIQLVVLSVPFYFFLVNTEEGALGFLSGLLYWLTKSSILVANTGQICFFDSAIFALGFSFITFGLAFQKEQSLKNVKFSLLGTFVVFLAYSFAIFTVLTYFNIYSGIGCFHISFDLPSFF